MQKVKCKECRYCKKICQIPAWVYCSDECKRLMDNKWGRNYYHNKKLSTGRQ